MSLIQKILINNNEEGIQNNSRSLFFLMTVLTKTLFALVSSHFMTLSFFTAWHNFFF